MLKIMTLNMWGYHDWNNRKGNIVTLVKREEPDCIALQEVLTNHAFSDYPSSDFIASGCNYKYRTFAPTFARNNSRDREGNRTQRAPHGQAFLSKHPIIVSESYFLMLYPEHPEENSILVCEIETNGKLYDFCNIHLANSDIAYRHLDQLLSFLNKRDATPVILGDFNIYNLADYKTDNALLNAYELSSELSPYISYPEDNDTLDYIAVPKTKYHLSNIVCHNDYVSDHRALSATVGTV